MSTDKTIYHIMTHKRFFIALMIKQATSKGKTKYTNCYNIEEGMNRFHISNRLLTETESNTRK